MKDKAEKCANIELMQILLSEALDTLSQIAADPAGTHTSHMGTALDPLHRLQKSEGLLDDPSWWPPTPHSHQAPATRRGQPAGHRTRSA
ncbi:MAG TPA: hypothetical protein VGD71_21720 [Kribbella sp.]